MAFRRDATGKQSFLVLLFSLFGVLFYCFCQGYHRLVNKQFPAVEYGVSCSLIIGQRKVGTDLKKKLNNLLSDFAVGDKTE